MNDVISYTFNDAIDKEIRKYHLIPHRVTRETLYKKNHIYYSSYWGAIFKVLSVEYDEKTNEFFGAYIRYESNYYGMICSELNIDDYELEIDHKKLYKENIVNSNIPYSGAEIRYWFFVNNINGFNPVYRGFWKFVDNTSGHKISDENKYIVCADINPKTGNYINCMMKRVKDTSRM